MKKVIGLLLAGAITVFLCGCQKAQTPVEEPTETEITEEITEENLVLKLQGRWVSPDGYLMGFDGNEFSDGFYRSEGGLPGIVDTVTKLDSNQFEVTIHFPDGYIYENLIPAHDKTFLFAFDGESATDVTVTNGEGFVYECQYAGTTDEEMFAKCEEIVEY